MSNSFKLTITWALLVASTLISFFVADLGKNGIFVSILAYKKFLLIGFIYMGASRAHWVYKLVLMVTGFGLLLANLVWR